MVVAHRLSSEEILKSCHIPPVPKILHQIMDAASSVSTPTSELANLILKDPGFCLKVLRHVNSAFYSIHKNVTSIQQAIVLLGYSTIKSIAAALMILDTFGKAEGIDAEALTKVWSHSLGVGNLVRILAQKESRAKIDELYLSSLLHDLGHLIISQYLGSNGEYVSLIRNSEFPDSTHERQKFMMDHTDLGAALLLEWKFPNPIIDLVKHHDDVSLATHLLVSGAKRDPVYLKMGDLLEDFLREAGQNTDPLFEDLNTLLPETLKNGLGQLGWTVEELRTKKELLLSSIDTRSFAP